MNSTDSYCPLTKPSLGGQSGCMQGLEMTMKCLGVSVNRRVFVLAPSDAGEAGRETKDSGSLKAEDEVSNKVTKSRGVVGPGNCADR